MPTSTPAAVIDVEDPALIERLCRRDAALHLARMLESGQYHGLRRDGRLVCIAGIHVFSPRYRVAALGNITTDPSHRGQGFATGVTARLCQSLRDSGIETIGLNVKADNAAAIACYQRLGFVEIGEYDEYMLDSLA